jgi:hypothetical protein
MRYSRLFLPGASVSEAKNADLMRVVFYGVGDDNRRHELSHNNANLPRYLDAVA